MMLADLLDICRAYAALGDAVSSQLDAVVEQESLDDQNPAALQLAGDRVLLKILDLTEPDEDIELREQVRAVLGLLRAGGVALRGGR